MVIVITSNTNNLYFMTDTGFRFIVYNIIYRLQGRFIASSRRKKLYSPLLNPLRRLTVTRRSSLFNRLLIPTEWLLIAFLVWYFVIRAGHLNNSCNNSM